MEYRDPTKQELDILKHLLSLHFEGATSLKTQLNGLKVHSFDDDDNYGSIGLETSGGEVAVVTSSVPAEGRAYDKDGIPIDTLLHVADGRMVELEFLKVDGSPIIQQPEASAFTFTSN